MSGGDETEEPIYEPAPAVTALTGNESAPDPATLAAACWLLQRYSSHSYIARAHALFRSVVSAFDAWTNAAKRLSPDIAKRWGQDLHEHDAAFERGVRSLSRGRTRDAYGDIAAAVRDLEPDDPRNERGLSLTAVLEGLGLPAVVAAGERAGAMALRIHHTLEATWAFERLFADRLSLHLRPLRLPERLPAVTVPPRGAPEVKTDGRVPQTGIWIPVTFRNACPNLLVAGSRAPLATRPGERIDYPEIAAEGPYEARAAWCDYVFITEPAVWRLVSPDERYRGGTLEDDPAWLDEENAFPS